MTMKMPLSPLELDNQSNVKIDRWVDLDSQDAIDMDSDRALTKKMIKIGFDGDFMTTDSNGRIWGKSPENDTWFPFHFEYGSKKIGYRIAKKAAN